ncbi:hypothetical protein [Azonexus hydrophilus]|uniref:Uncharacterized protein n=1 Tax=Azonexus hydrophilus TaxID=418702 RepID=A0ABZ2XM79_9RHOO
MYSAPKLGFGDHVRKVESFDDVVSSIKEGSMTGSPARTFYGTMGRRVFSFDGMFVVDQNSGDIVPDNELDQTISKGLFVGIN